MTGVSISTGKTVVTITPGDPTEIAVSTSPVVVDIGLGGPAGPPGRDFANGGVIMSSGVELLVGYEYGVATSLGAFTASLPPLVSVNENERVRVDDLEYLAASANFTVAVAAATTDQIAYQADQSGETVLQDSGFRAEWIAHPSEGYWRLVFSVT